MYAKQDPSFVEALTKSFNMQMLVISIVGFLISNQDFTL
jgi:hypothetical protein